MEGKKVFVRLLTFFIFLSVGIINLNAQERSLEIIGIAETNFKPIPNAKVILFKDGSSESNVSTNANGEFRFNLAMNHEYLLEISAPGMLSKRIAFNTEIPDDFEGKWTMEFAMSLVKGCEGVNTSALEDPVDRVKFSSNKGEFISDESHVYRMQGRLEKMMIAIDECQAEKYQQAVDEANELVKQGEFTAARNKYEEALEVYPDDRSVLKRLSYLEKQEEEANENNKLYADAIAMGDEALAAGNLQSAKEYYEKAADYMPGNSYPADKITAIDQQLAEQRQAEQTKQAKEQQYTALIAQANAAVNSENYVTAKDLYQQALIVKPGSSFAQQKITELEPKIKQEQQMAASKAANDKAFEEAMAMGQQAMLNNDFETAKQHYARAAALKPNQSVTQQKIAEADRAIEAAYLAGMQAEKAAARQKLEQKLNEGDALYDQGNYAAAEQAYVEALKVNPNDSYAQQRLNKTRNTIAVAEAEKQKQMQRAFQGAVDNGDELLAAGNFVQAVEAYKQALIKKPGDPDVQSKLAAAENKLQQNEAAKALEAQKRSKYDQFIASGNSLFAQQKYIEAKKAFQQAADLYPSQSVPRTRIAEIDALEAKKQQEQQYASFISKADQLLAAGNLTEAKAGYQQALALKSGDEYSRTKIAEVDGLINENQRAKAENEARKKQYDAIIAEADKMFADNYLDAAKSKYQQALNVADDREYANKQIARIDASLAEKRKLEEEKLAAEEKFRALIIKADQLLAQKQHDEAKLVYQQALAVKSSESYPRTKINEIDMVLAEQAKKASEEQARKLKYDRLIAEADKLFASAQLEQAKENYTQAKSLIPSELYPDNQLNKIKELQAQKKAADEQKLATDRKYAESVKQADELFSKGQYLDAKQYYTQALALKAGEVHPKNQLERISQEMAALEQQKKEKAAFEQKYSLLIASADAAFDKRSYEEAKSSYNEALKMKPNESHPRSQLNKIAEFERILARQQAEREAAIAAATTTSAAAATAPKPAKLAALDFKNDSERDKYLNGLKKDYPDGVTKEVHKEKNSTTERYVVIRDNEVTELRMVKFSWGGVEYSLNGKPVTSQYFNSQVRTRDGEFFQEIKL